MNRSLGGIKIRLFLTCWLIFILHFATDFVREHYLVLSIVEDFSFRLDKYAGLHPDIFEIPNQGAYHGANPGASMIAAIPYFVFKPVVNFIADHYSTKAGQGISREDGAGYKDHRQARVRFYKEIRERGLDIKFGLVGIVTMVFCMAPLSALSAVTMFQVMARLGLSNWLSIWMALLYALGTPVFFRTGYLNQNLMVGIFGFMAFSQLWRAGEERRERIWLQFAVAGFLGGLAVLCDYSGLVPLMLLYGYGVLHRAKSVPFNQALRESFGYFGGAIGPILLLWFYQWISFGHPFYPGQHYMPPVEWIDIGYQGFGLPSGELVWILLFDLRFGLFVCSPILLLAFLTPIFKRGNTNLVPFRETMFILLFFIIFTLFSSCIQYTRLHWVTGIRYIVPIIPFLFLPTACVMVRIPTVIAYGLAILAFAESWSMSMVRRVGVPEEGVIDSIVRVFLDGLQLPWLDTLSKMSTQYVPFLSGHNPSPLFLFVIWGFLIYGIWRIEFPWENLAREITKSVSNKSFPKPSISPSRNFNE